MKEIRYIYLLKRTGHDEARLVVKKRMIDADKIERKLHQHFKKSRFTMTKKIKQGQWAQSHVKIGISNDVDRRLRDVNNDFFKSGRTEWFAMHLFERMAVHALIRWYAYRWWILVGIIAFIWYGNSY